MYRLVIIAQTSFLGRQEIWKNTSRARRPVAAEEMLKMGDIEKGMTSETVTQRILSSLVDE